jgi:hypothetical protein
VTARGVRSSRSGVESWPQRLISAKVTRSGGDRPVARILVAASSEPREILERILTGHELSCPRTMDEAEKMLREHQFDLIICTVFFDDSRMFDLLRLAKSLPTCKAVPFVCARLRRHVLDSQIAREGVAFTCRALGAAAFLDVSDYQVPPDRPIRAAVDRLLKTGPPTSIQ